MVHDDDIVIEMARVTREGLARAIARHQSQNEGRDYHDVVMGVQNCTPLTDGLADSRESDTRKRKGVRA